MVYFQKLANFQKLTIWKTIKIPKNFNLQNSQKFFIQKFQKFSKFSNFEYHQIFIEKFLK